MVEETVTAGEDKAGERLRNNGEADKVDMSTFGPIRVRLCTTYRLQLQNN
jgi:hypothetical protein